MRLSRSTRCRTSDNSSRFFHRGPDMEIPTPKSQAPNPKRVLAWGVGIWALGFGISISAQSPYVAATIGADVSRVGHTDSNLSSTPSSGSEVVSGSVRVGTPVGEN